MPETIETVEPSSNLRYYACGETDQQLALMFRGHKKELRTFPAGVFLFQHQSGKNVLFDTGYSTSIYRSALPGAVYRRLLPPRITEENEINSQLIKDGIDPRTIGQVVLSHLHPDHIGGVRFFPEAQFVLSREADETLQSPRLRDGVIPGLLPEGFDSASKLVLDKDHLTSTSNDFVQGYDLLGDQSFLLTELPGHARGQIGALALNKLMLAVDAAWGRDLLEKSADMRFLAKLANYDMAAYRATSRRLQQLEMQGIELCFSHDIHEREVLQP